MFLVGLTGGIGSGKSTVARRLAAHGAVVVDADQLARQVVEPGQPALAEITERFGDGVINDDGTLDRAALASIVFNDPDALADLNAITHPRIAEATTAAFTAVAADEESDGQERVVLHDLPLLAESPELARAYAAVIVVEADPELRVERLVARGLTEQDARARMANQASDETRRALATHLITNDGDLDDLHAAADAVWDDLQARRAAAAEAVDA